MKIGIVEFIERYFEEHRKKFSQEEYFIEAMCKEMKREGLDIKVEVGLLGNQKGKELNGIRGANPKMIIEDEGEEESGGYRSCTFQEAMKLLGFRDRWQLDTILGKEIKRIGKRGVSVLLDREDVEGYRDGVRKVKEVKVERKKKKEVKMYVPKYKPTKDEMKGLWDPEDDEKEEVDDSREMVVNGPGVKNFILEKNDPQKIFDDED